MSYTEITVEGTLMPDGSLELDQKPDLPAGRVTIIVRQQTEPAIQEGWWPYVQRVRAEIAHW